MSIFLRQGHSGGSKFVSQNTVPAKTVDFKGHLENLGTLNTSIGDCYWAVYPYDTDVVCYGNNVSATLPANQTAVPGSFAEKCHPAVARSATTSLKFYAVAGGLKFTVSRSDIKSVSIKGNNNEDLAGGYSVKFDDDGKPTVENNTAENEVTLLAPGGGTFTPGESYFISLLPTTLSKGITITLDAVGQRGTIVSNKPQTIKRSVYGVIKNIDSKAQWQTVADAVDLGLSVKWASFNVGATEPKSNYNWSTYKWCNGSSNTQTKYNTNSSYGTVDNKTVLDPEDDAAHVNWGGGFDSGNVGRDDTNRYYGFSVRQIFRSL